MECQKDRTDLNGCTASKESKVFVQTLLNNDSDGPTNVGEQNKGNCVEGVRPQT